MVGDSPHGAIDSLIASQGSLMYGGVAAENLYPVALLNGQKLHRHFSATRSTGVPWVISCPRSCAKTCALVLNSRGVHLSRPVQPGGCDSVLQRRLCLGANAAR